ncbi:MAG TPA: DNRLRE domain-containing protein, partial [Solirubrobacterales bacterium]
MRELPLRRTATSNTFLLSDGQLETRLFEVPVNYRDEEGNWKPIGEDLVELPGGAVTNGSNSFDVHLPEDLDEAPVRIDLGGEEWISQQPLGISTQPVDLGGEVATYESAGSTAGFEFNGLASGLKENIVLAGPSAPSTYRYALDASVGISPELTEEGSIEFRDSEGVPVGYMPPPVMADSADEPQVSNAVHYAIEPKESGGWLLSVEADPEWLSDPARVFPARIDPTWEVEKPALDCTISSTEPTTSYCAPGQTYHVAKAKYPTSTGPSQLGRTLLRFDTSAIPKTAYLTSATIGLHSAKTATNITKVDMFDVSRSWNSTATWNRAESALGPNGNWNLAGGDYGKYMPTPTSLTPAERGGLGSGWWNFSSPELTWLTQRWLDGVVPNNGVLLKLADEAPYVCCIERRVEWESSSATNKPKLTLTFLEPASADRRVTSPTD